MNKILKINTQRVFTSVSLSKSLSNSFVKTQFRKFCSDKGKTSFSKKWNYRAYGKYGTMVYIGMSISTLTTFYLLISYNYLKKDKVINYLESKGFNPQEKIDKYGKGKINFALAYACLFATKPIRIVLSCVLAGVLTKRFASTGVQKTVKNTSVIRQYGALGVTLYFSYWIVTGVIVYWLVVNKYIDTDKVFNKIKGSWLERYYDKIKGNRSTDFATAYLINACLELIRLPTFILFAKLFLKRRR